MPAGATGTAISPISAGDASSGCLGSTRIVYPKVPGVPSTARPAYHATEPSPGGDSSVSSAETGLVISSSSPVGPQITSDLKVPGVPSTARPAYHATEPSPGGDSSVSSAETGLVISSSSPVGPQIT